MPPPSLWTAAHVTAIADSAIPELPVLGASDVVPVVPGFDLWDMWPVRYADGRTACFGSSALWMLLSAPVGGDPDERHALARIRLLQHETSDGAARGHAGAWERWLDRGNLLPDGVSPGSREWAGSAIVDADGTRVTLYFTAAGRRGEAALTYEQRIFETTGVLSFDDDRASIAGWSVPVEVLQADGTMYVQARQATGAAGRIKGFRDPGYFRDPADGAEYLLFTGSAARPPQDYDAVIGLGQRRAGQGIGRWQLLPPIISAAGLNRELERPHVLLRGGLYYVFWSTQRSVFAPGTAGPSGLYGMVGSHLLGPYAPLNGTGLVATTPAAEPRQSYSWLVLESLEVVSFVDYWGLAGRDPDAHPLRLRSQFGGVPAPRFSIVLDGDRAMLADAGRRPARAEPAVAAQ